MHAGDYEYFHQCLQIYPTKHLYDTHTLSFNFWVANDLSYELNIFCACDTHLLLCHLTVACATLACSCRLQQAHTLSSSMRFKSFKFGAYF